MRTDIVLINVIMLFEFLSFFYVVFQREFRDFSHKTIMGLVLWGLTWIIALLVGFDWQKRIVGPLSAFYIAYVLLIWLMFEIPFFEMMLMVVANWLVLSLIENNCIIVLRKINSSSSKNLDILIMFIITVCIWLFYFTFKGKYNARVFRLPVKVWGILDLIMLILMAMMSFFGYVIVKQLPDDTMSGIGQKLLLGSGISIILLLFVFVYFYSSAYEYRAKKEMTEMQIMQQREYFVNLLEREAETRKFRHDVMNDLLELYNCCDNRKCKQMRDYLQKMIGIITEISQKSYNVGNEIVNTLLNYYLNPIKEKCKISVNGMITNDLSVDDRDLCVIAANLIKNAVEAVDKMDDGKIWVNVGCGKDSLYIQVKNTYTGTIEFDKNGVPITSKDDCINHGIGVLNVYEIAQKNSGTCYMEAHNGIFKAEVYVKNNRS